MSSHRPHVHARTRRELLSGTGLVALAAGTSQLLGAAPREPVSVPSGPWSGGDVPADFRSERRMAAAAQALLASLDTTQREKLVYPNLGDAARTRWSNFPAGVVPRPGISLADLADAQRVRVYDLLCASTSSQGFHKLAGAIRADQLLHDMQHDDPLFGAGLYYASIYGSPERSPWAWMLTGHHMAAIFTIDGERTAFTPMFSGAQPLEIPSGTEAGWRVLPREASRASDVLHSLSEDQRRIAVTSAEAPIDLLAGPGRQASLATFEGIAAARLGDGQQRLLWRLIEEFVGNADVDAAAAQLGLVKATWGDTHFSWRGPAAAADARYYFRVHAPRLVIEYDVQEPLTSDGGHVHAITRDPLDDYGSDWLGLHYRESSGMPHGPGGDHGPPGFGPPGSRPPRRAAIRPAGGW